MDVNMKKFYNESLTHWFSLYEEGFISYRETFENALVEVYRKMNDFPVKKGMDVPTRLFFERRAKILYNIIKCRFVTLISQAFKNKGMVGA